MLLIILFIHLLLILIFLMAGVFKLIKQKEQIIAGGGTWAEGFETPQIRIIGVIECVVALMLLINLIFLSKPILTIISASTMGLLMLGAGFVHARRKEYTALWFAIVLALLAFMLVWLNVRS
jgi:hypothetical protein